MYHNLKVVKHYPPWDIVKEYMPQVFEDYSNTRLIIDATEFSVEQPSSLIMADKGFQIQDLLGQF